MPDDPPTPPPADATVPDAPTLAAAQAAAAPTAASPDTPPAPTAPEAANDDDEWEYVDEDEDDEDDGAQAPAAPPARSRVAELLALSAFCVMLGGMFAGAVLGVMYAPARRAAPQGVGALAASRADASPEAGANVALAADAACDADEAGAAQEADPELAGDGVMDDLDDGPAEPVPAATPTAPAPAPPRPVLARTTPPSAAPAPTSAPAPAPPRGRRVITSDDVPEGPAQGYVHGRATRITVTRLDGKPVEVHTAAAYRRMREAAQRDGVALRIASGFRTMEHQQALYRAYRQGRGNLAAVPGHSNHQSGHALDLNTSTPGVFRWLTRNGRRFGFRRTVPTEPWHWEWW